MNHRTQTKLLPKAETPFRFAGDSLIGYVENNRLVVADLEKQTEVFAAVIEKELKDFSVVLNGEEVKAYLFGPGAIDVISSLTGTKTIALDDGFVRLLRPTTRDDLLIATKTSLFSLNTCNDSLSAVSLPAAFSCDKVVLFTPGECIYREGRSIWVVDMLNGTVLLNQAFSTEITAFDAKADGMGKFSQIAVGLLSGSIVLLNRAKSRCMKSDLKWHSGPVTCLAFSRETNKLYSGGNEGVLVLWDILSGTKDFLPRFEAPLQLIEPSHNDEYIAIGLRDGQVRAVRTENFESVLTVAVLPDSLFEHKADLNASNYVYKDEAGRYKIVRHMDSKLKADCCSFNPSTRNTMDLSKDYQVKIVNSTPDGRFACSYETFKRRGLVIFDKLRFFNSDDKANGMTLINTVDNPEQLTEIDCLCSYFDEGHDGYLIRILLHHRSWRSCWLLHP